jgi:hypothetical protein
MIATFQPLRQYAACACSPRTSGQREFDVQYGENIAGHIGVFHPTYSAK